MALGALIGAYQEDDAGGLRALLPLAGRSLLEYQARCLAAAGAAPLVVLVERVPLALNEAFERLRSEGIAVIPVSEGSEAASRFEAGSQLIMLADGIAPDMEDLGRLIEEGESAVLTVADDEAHKGFERIDGSHRWAGVAKVDAAMLGATAAMLGDWDLQSTLLRRAIQAGARLIPSATSDGRGPFLASGEEAMAGYERRLLVASRTAREDAVSRYLLPVVEEVATEKLMETRIRPDWLLYAALILTLGAAFAFTRGWLWPAVGMLVVSTPLDLIARRLGMLRLKPLPDETLAQRLLWPASGLSLIALGWWEARHGSGWGASMASIAALAFAEAYRIERTHTDIPISGWLFSRRNAILALFLFALANAWTAYVVAVLGYAGISFFFAQYLVHRLRPELTTH